GEARTPSPSQTITAFDPRAGERASPRPCMALVTSSGLHLSDEIRELLRRRLRIAGLIGLAGFGTFFVKHLLFPVAGGPETIVQDLQSIVVAVLVVCCAVLWSNLRLSARAARGIELLMFGTMALFFAYVQVDMFAGGKFLSWA